MTVSEGELHRAFSKQHGWHFQLEGPAGKLRVVRVKEEIGD